MVFIAYQDTLYSLMPFYTVSNTVLHDHSKAILRAYPNIVFNTVFMTYQDTLHSSTYYNTIFNTVLYDPCQAAVVNVLHCRLQYSIVGVTRHVVLINVFYNSIQNSLGRVSGTVSGSVLHNCIQYSTWSVFRNIVLIQVLEYSIQNRLVGIS